MYVLNKLESMSRIYGRDNLDGELANYFIEQIHHIDAITIQKCMKDTGISKASIHRFYSKAGFNSFKEFTSVLENEYTSHTLVGLHPYEKINEYIQSFSIDHTQLKNLYQSIINADRVYLYGNWEEIDGLKNTITKLRNKGIKVHLINGWKLDSTIEMLKDLHENDLLIIIDQTLTIQNYHETSMNNTYLLNFDLMNEGNYSKYYIGQGKGNRYLSFNLLQIPYVHDSMNTIGMFLFDMHLSSMFKG